MCDLVFSNSESGGINRTHIAAANVVWQQIQDMSGCNRISEDFVCVNADLKLEVKEED